MAREGVRFVNACEVEDALRADHLRRALEAAGIAGMVHQRLGGTASALTDGLTRPWWEVRVPEPELGRARAIIGAELQALDTFAAEDAAAAEDEAAPQEPGASTSNSA